MKLENEIAEYLKNCTLINHAKANGIKAPVKCESSGRASEDWMSGYLKRNLSLSIRKPEQTSQARAAGFNKVVVEKFYDNLSILCMINTSFHREISSTAMKQTAQL